MTDLLYLEPDRGLNRLLTRMLRKAGYNVRPGFSIEDGIRLLDRNAHQLTIIRASMPWRTSREFLDLLAEKGLPVLFITADKKNEKHLRAMYPTCSEVLIIPCGIEDVLRAVKRLEQMADHTLTSGSLRMDTHSRRVTIKGEELPLTAQEFELLHALMVQPNEPVSREELLRKAWGYQAMGMTRTVDVHVQRLRRKLGPAWIETVYRRGYRLSPAF